MNNPPTATYRLHLTHSFTLFDAADLVDHIAALGVDWVYASPIFTTPSKATHGYHILDPATINPELGGEEGLGALSEALLARDMGLLLDIVPNHLAASVDNPWWADVLRHGEGSPHAAAFDVDYAAGPIVLPILGEPVESAIASGTLRLEGGALRYHDLALPLAPGSDRGTIEDVLARQHYALHEWRSGQRLLTYRRFFAINDLVGVRVEDPAVFDAMHAAVVRLLADGRLQGVRVDHIDGLRDPGAYLQRLREVAGDDTWILVEKILEDDEQLPRSWPIAGTTGYEVNAWLQSWQHDPGALADLRRAFASRTGITGSAAEALPPSKLHVLEELFPAEVGRVVGLLQASGCPGEAEELAQAVRLLVAHFPGYRSHATADGGPLSAEDLARLEEAERGAGAAAHVVAEHLRSDAGREALLRFQQLTGATAAKGFEDRLLYQYVAESGLCEVGRWAAYLDTLLDEEEVASRLGARPLDALTSTSTHDTKRGEDVRARLTTLAERPQAFLDLLDQLEGLVADDPAVAPLDAHARWLLAQSAVGALGWEPEDPSELPGRLRDYAVKALREAGLRTSHDDPDQEYEAAAQAYATALVSPGPVGDAVAELVDQLAIPSACASLATVLLKIVGPGVPDIYRGTEAWDGSLVDPDNRRPLQVERLRGLVATLAGASVESVRDRWQDGALKVLVTSRALRARQSHRDAVLHGPLRVLPAEGDNALHVMAILRGNLLAVATRLPWTLAGGDWPVGETWGDTWINLPLPASRARELVGNRDVEVQDGRMRLSAILRDLPVALLEIT